MKGAGANLEQGHPPRPSIVNMQFTLCEKFIGAVLGRDIKLPPPTHPLRSFALAAASGALGFAAFAGDPPGMRWYCLRARVANSIHHPPLRVSSASFPSSPRLKFIASSAMDIGIPAPVGARIRRLGYPSREHLSKKFLLLLLPRLYSLALPDYKYRFDRQGNDCKRSENWWRSAKALNFPAAILELKFKFDQTETGSLRVHRWPWRVAIYGITGIFPTFLSYFSRGKIFLFSLGWHVPPSHPLQPSLPPLLPTDPTHAPALKNIYIIMSFPVGFPENDARKRMRINEEDGWTDEWMNDKWISGE